MKFEHVYGPTIEVYRIDFLNPIRESLQDRKCSHCQGTGFFTARLYTDDGTSLVAMCEGCKRIAEIQ